MLAMLQAVVSGWGALDNGVGNFPSALTEVTVTTMTNTACNSRGGFGASPHGFTEHAVPHEHAGG